MKNLILGFLLFAAAGSTLSSCKDDDKLPAPPTEDVPLIFPQISSDPNKGFYNYQLVRLSENTLISQGKTFPVFEFTLNPIKETGTKIQTVEVYRSHRRGADASSYVYGPRVKVGDYSSFPATVSINSKEATNGLYKLAATPTDPLIPVFPVATPTSTTWDPTRTNNRIVPPEAVVFTFEYIMEGGRRVILTPVDKNGVIIGTLVPEPYSIAAVIRNPL